ncbi:AIM9 [Candida pseudojiufengensis]|uniref:AIM9 n=1 Tax=Candida pseudojiufengensis TaxID=497109 RepID=UPI0022240247|nr:AIM9 [Candida pseudojiufengensis]KAI5966145.1 AIM9 [Candida pseudojiufengensis]
MLSKTVRSCLKSSSRSIVRASEGSSIFYRQYATEGPSIPSQPKEIYTKLSDSKDPQRNPFFQYSWGSWLKNDNLKKQQRQTKFSIEGLTSFFNDLKVKETDTLTQPKENKGIYILENNSNKDLLGETNEKISVKSIASIHEGKHHRIYKINLNTGKNLILRIPYKLDSDESIASKIKSEVATSDFLNLKLNLKVPKILAYSPSKSNIIESPFIIQESIEGDLLMKKWHPLDPDSSETDKKLKEVINPIAKFQDNILNITFNQFGSLYFFNDVEPILQSKLPYNDETDDRLKNRWRIGPSVEKIFTKDKNKLSQKIINQYNGPWDASNPISLMESVSEIELENAKHKLSLLESESGGDVTESKELLQNQIKTFEHLKKITPSLINSKSKSIRNVEDLFKPRLYIPDLDPLNVIETPNKEYYFIDFENSTIKPFILNNYPNFIAYNGAKIYDLKEDIPEFEHMDPMEKQQYEFMYYKTRNERIWEIELNKNKHNLIAIASPHLKILKSPYLQALDLKNPKDYLYVEGSIIQLQAMWDTYVANELVNNKNSNSNFPIQYDENYLDKHQSDLSDYQLETVSSPFNATGGWIPQDMFDTLKNQGIIVDEGNGNYKIETKKVLDNPPPSSEEESK